MALSQSALLELVDVLKTTDASKVVQCAAWQRRVHFLRNVLTKVPKADADIGTHKASRGGPPTSGTDTKPAEHRARVTPPLGTQSNAADRGVVVAQLKTAGLRACGGPPRPATQTSGCRWMSRGVRVTQFSPRSRTQGERLGSATEERGPSHRHAPVRAAGSSV